MEIVTVCPNFRSDGEDVWYCQSEEGHEGDCVHETREWRIVFGPHGFTHMYRGILR